ncbi:hypothetical protein QO004_002824 [Rhizobium mesoamericanum]|nr:hypothetical protein [Rhizobium mesoamericanum]
MCAHRCWQGSTESPSVVSAYVFSFRADVFLPAEHAFRGAGRSPRIIGMVRRGSLGRKPACRQNGEVGALSAFEMQLVIFEDSISGTSSAQTRGRNSLFGFPSRLETTP